MPRNLSWTHPPFPHPPSPGRRAAPRARPPLQGQPAAHGRVRDPLRAEGLVCVKASTNLPGAFNRERFQLRLGGHPDRRLQQAWRTHGEAALRFEVLDTLKPRADATDAEHRADLAALLALWQEELAA